MTQQTQQVRSVEDVIEQLKHHHKTLKASMPEVLKVHGADRARAFANLCKFLASHEALEQVVIHPHARQDASAAAVADRIKEEEEATQVITAMEGLEIDSEEFREQYTAFMLDVVEHAEHEEHEEFDKIDHPFSDEELSRINLAIDMLGHDTADPTATAPFKVMLEASIAALEHDDLF